MSLTVNSQPNSIDKSAAFNVTTSLSEDGTHVNLRIRGDVYHEGITKATVEKPKGLADFDFSDILKSLIPGLKQVKDTGNFTEMGSVGSNLITSIASSTGTYTTLTTSVNTITSAICTVVSSLEINAVSMVVGELYLLYSPTYASTGTTPNIWIGGQSEYMAINVNAGILLIPTSTASLKVMIGGVASQNFSGTFYLYKITTNRSTIGGLLAPYFISFTEVYEDAAGATQLGANSHSSVLRYVNAPNNDAAFTEYVLHDNASLFACKTLKGNVVKFFTPVPLEYSLCFFTERVDLEVFFSADGAAYNHALHPFSYEGWGVININVGEIMSSVTSNLRIYINDLWTGTISEVLTIYVDSSCIDERTVLEFDGLVGGKEYLAFEGIKDLGFTTIRNYYSSSKKAKKPILFIGINRQTIETRFKDMANAEYLKSLLISENVKRLEPSYATPTDVTILTDSVTIDKGREFFTNRLDIEYEY